MKTSDPKRPRDLEARNNSLKKLLAEAVLDNEALKVQDAANAKINDLQVCDIPSL